MPQLNPFTWASRLLGMHLIQSTLKGMSWVVFFRGEKTACEWWLHTVTLINDIWYNDIPARKFSWQMSPTRWANKYVYVQYWTWSYIVLSRQDSLPESSQLGIGILFLVLTCTFCPECGSGLSLMLSASSAYQFWSPHAALLPGKDVRIDLRPAVWTLTFWL